VLGVGGIEKFIANKWRILGSAAAKEIDFLCLHFSFPVERLDQTASNKHNFASMIKRKVLKYFCVCLVSIGAPNFLSS